VARLRDDVIGNHFVGLEKARRRERGILLLSALNRL